MAKLFGWMKDQECPKCGSFHLYGPTHHVAKSASYLDFYFPFLHRCGWFAVDHLHYRCASCSFVFSTVCNDIKEELKSWNS